MERRQFLVGAGSILTTAFITNAKRYLEVEASVIPLIDNRAAHEVIYFVERRTHFELRLNTPYCEVPEYTNREVLELYYGECLPVDEPIKLSKFRELYFEFGLTAKELDSPAHQEFFIDSWAREDSPVARAYNLLEGLDLFDYGQASGWPTGGLNFIDGPCPGNDYLGVQSNDRLSASLLQARLAELGQNLKVELA